MTPLVWGAIWALGATVTALLPRRRQMIPGLALLVTAPVLLVWIGRVHGWAWAFVDLLAVLSLFRLPLLALISRARRA